MQVEHAAVYSSAPTLRRYSATSQLFPLMAYFSGDILFHYENNRVTTSEKRQKAVQTIFKRACRRGSYKKLSFAFTSAFDSTRNRQASS